MPPPPRPRRASRKPKKKPAGTSLPIGPIIAAIVLLGCCYVGYVVVRDAAVADARVKAEAADRAAAEEIAFAEALAAAGPPAAVEREFADAVVAAFDAIAAKVKATAVARDILALETAYEADAAALSGSAVAVAEVRQAALAEGVPVADLGACFDPLSKRIDEAERRLNALPIGEVLDRLARNGMTPEDRDRVRAVYGDYLALGSSLRRTAERPFAAVTAAR